MQISPIKSVIKPPLIEPNKIGLRAGGDLTALGNSIQLTGTTEEPLPIMEIRGETLCKKVVFGTNYIRIDGVANPFTTGNLTFVGLTTSANIKTVAISSVSGQYIYFPAATFTAATELQGTITDGTNTVNIAVSPDNPQVLTSITNFGYLLRAKNLLKYPYYHSTFTSNGITFTDNGNGSVTVNGTASATTYFYMSYSGTSGLPVKSGTYAISGGVSANLLVFADNESAVRQGTDTGAGATFTLSKSGYLQCAIRVASGATITSATIYPQLEKASAKSTYEPYQGVTATITLKDTSNNQLTLAGRVATYKTDGTPNTFIGQDKIVKKTDGKWYHRKMGAFESDATTRADFWNLITPYIDTELCAADQTALNSVAKTYAGITNIMLSTDIGQIYVELSQWSDSAKR